MITNLPPIPSQANNAERYFFAGVKTNWDWRPIPYPFPERLRRGFLTERQRECLDFIRRYQRTHSGHAPTVQEITDALGYAAKGDAVHGLLRRMEARNVIRIIYRRTAKGDRFWAYPRRIEILEGAS